MLSVRNIVQITAQNEIILVAEVNQIIKSVTACHPEIPERVEQAQASPTLRHSPVSYTHLDVYKRHEQMLQQ